MNGENKKRKNLATGLKALLLRFITEIVIKWGCTQFLDVIDGYLIFIVENSTHSIQGTIHSIVQLENRKTQKQRAEIKEEKMQFCQQKDMPQKLSLPDMGHLTRGLQVRDDRDVHMRDGRDVCSELDVKRNFRV